VCPTEILQFNDRAAEFKALNCELVAASVDSVFAHHAWVQQSRKMGGLGPKMDIPLLADPTHEISKNYGVYLEDVGHTLRGLFIINEEGVLKHITQNSPEAGRSVDEALRLLQAYQFAAKHGEVCPANWQPGKPTIKPTTTDKVEYFSKQ
jgi:peroxiredoxin (alkyl hydroperoxide reductase subunit C)